MVLAGPGGIGKSATAYRYSKRVEEKKRVQVQWICAENEMEVQKGVRNFLLDEFQLSEQILVETEKSELKVSGRNSHIAATFRKQVSEAKKKRYHFVLDNVNAVQDITIFLEDLKNLKVLITTREHLHPILRDRIQLSGLSSEEAINFLNEYVGNMNSSSKTNRANSRTDSGTNCLINRIVRILSDRDALYPLILKIAAEFMIEKSIYPIEKILSDFQKKDISANVLCDRIFRSLADDPNYTSTWQLFAHTAYLHPDFIPIELLNRLLGRELGRSELTVQNVLEIISSDDVVGVRIHRICQDAIRNLVNDRTHQVAQNVADALNHFFPKVDLHRDEKRVAATRYGAHVVFYLDHAPELACSEARTRIRQKLAGYYEKVLIKWRGGADKMYSEMLQKQCSDRISFSVHLAATYFHLNAGHLNRAQELALRCLKLRGQNTPNNSKIARIQRLLGDVYAERGDYNSACTHYTEAVRIYHEVGDKQELARVLRRFGWATYNTGTLHFL